MATVGALADVAPPSRGNPLSSTQRWRRVAVILLVLLLLTAAVHAQQIPAIPEIPACVTGELRAQLEQALASLVQRRNALREHANQHNGHCKAVLEGSPLEAPCTAEQAELTAAIRQHIAESLQFKAQVDSAAAACKQSLPTVSPNFQPTDLGDAALLLDAVSGRAAAYSGILKEDVKVFCDYVVSHGGQIVMQNVKFSAAALERITKGNAVPKPATLKCKSTNLSDFEGLVPVDPSLSKIEPGKIWLAKAEIDNCIYQKKCTEVTIKGMRVLADKDKNVFVSDYDPIAFSYSSPDERVYVGALGRGTDAAREAIYGLNSGLKLKIQNLDAAHNPDCVPPAIPFGATAFERDGNECRISKLPDPQALDHYLRQNSIPACWQQ